jgi:rubrerythrin
MQNLSSIEGILDFAIANELEANRFYLDLAQKVKSPLLKGIFEGFAQEEMSHKEKLEKAKTGEIKLDFTQKVDNLKIADYTVEVEPNPSLDYQGALILAMKKEKASFKLYSDLAAVASSEQIKNLFLALAQEEAKHKLRFEVEYDSHILEGN